jgi:hypothetical protein
MSRDKKPSRVYKLWNGGERANACALADELKVKETDWPEGMKAYRGRTGN